MQSGTKRPRNNSRIEILRPPRRGPGVAALRGAEPEAARGREEADEDERAGAVATAQEQPPAGPVPVACDPRAPAAAEHRGPVRGRGAAVRAHAGRAHAADPGDRKLKEGHRDGRGEVEVMQKYHHKSVFYVERDERQGRGRRAPTRRLRRDAQGQQVQQRDDAAQVKILAAPDSLFGVDWLGSSKHVVPTSLARCLFSEVRSHIRVLLDRRNDREQLGVRRERQVRQTRVDRVLHDVEEVHVRERDLVAGEVLALDHSLEHAKVLGHRLVAEVLELLRLFLRVGNTEAYADVVVEHLGERLGDHVCAERLDRVLRVQPTELGGIALDRSALGVDRAIDVEHRHLAERALGLERGKVSPRHDVVLKGDAAVDEEQARELAARVEVDVRKRELRHCAWNWRLDLRGGRKIWE
ncbi:hypothetical protein PybrP1_002559 [[Pythium] brassicae (nom. inval.)]|nr:hypothetical protein PybrP1_002559 [[Pythium] brassicae (nom. inval.)]